MLAVVNVFPTSGLDLLPYFKIMPSWIHKIVMIGSQQKWIEGLLWKKAFLKSWQHHDKDLVIFAVSLWQEWGFVDILCHFTNRSAQKTCFQFDNSLNLFHFSASELAIYYKWPPFSEFIKLDDVLHHSHFTKNKHECQT